MHIRGKQIPFSHNFPEEGILHVQFGGGGQSIISLNQAYSRSGLI